MNVYAKLDLWKIVHTPIAMVSNPLMLQYALDKDLVLLSTSVAATKMFSELTASFTDVASTYHLIRESALDMGDVLEAITVYAIVAIREQIAKLQHALEFKVQVLMYALDMEDVLIVIDVNASLITRMDFGLERVVHLANPIIKEHHANNYSAILQLLVTRKVLAMKMVHVPALAPMQLDISLLRSARNVDQITLEQIARNIAGRLKLVRDTVLATIQEIVRVSTPCCKDCGLE